jgi:hypothetical protein
MQPGKVKRGDLIMLLSFLAVVIALVIWAVR